MYYLEAALADYTEDGDTEAFWTALRDVAEAQGGIGKLAERTKINPQAPQRYIDLSTESALGQFAEHSFRIRVSSLLGICMRCLALIFRTVLLINTPLNSEIYPMSFGKKSTRGPGYRVYFSDYVYILVLLVLLCGGRKGTQLIVPHLREHKTLLE